MTYSLELGFRSAGAAPALGQIYIKTHTQDEDGLILISPHCVSFIELNYQVDRLIKELEDIRVRAKRKFENHDRRVRSK